METIAATAFKQTCLAILDRLGPDGIVSTKHGKPVAKLVPVEAGLGRPHRQPGGQDPGPWRPFDHRPSLAC